LRTAAVATDLYAKDSGYVLHVDADIGDHVKAGQVLVIDDPELQMQFVRAEVAVQ
jgi:multidrug efflux pump subunit AcrA (membrane-fusion protein)